jgi:hypothetical protein
MKKDTSSVGTIFRALLVCTATAGIALSLTSCNVRQTQEAKAPEVEVKDGQMPKYDVDTADVSVGTEKREVTVPTMDVTMPGDQTPTPSPTP